MAPRKRTRQTPIAVQEEPDTEMEELHDTILEAGRGRNHSTPAPPPAAPTGMINQLVEALSLAQTQNRKQIKAPAFNGIGNVELFIQQFKDVAAANHWTPEDSLLHLRLNLTDKAQECGEFDNLEEVWEELRSRFGLTYKQARDRLSSLRKVSGVTMHELGMEISRLTKLGYPAMAAPDQEDLALDRFQTVMNNVELRRYLTPLRPQTMRECLRLSEEFFQAEQGLKSTRVTAVTETPNPVVEAIKALKETVLKQAEEIKELKALPGPAPAAATSAPPSQAPAQGQLSLQDLLMASLATSLSNQGSRQPASRQRRSGPPSCYHCQGPHFKNQCPELKQQNGQGTTQTTNQRQPAGNYSGPTQ